ncbi:MAG: hypothetical protein FJ276_36850 [Planctomycetes bacterium]|nr:hypothetical protein [Planctomycetota bacterium]
MSSKRQQERARRARERICEIQKQIATFDIACRGSLLCRKKRCGNPKCRCARDPQALHGPYHELGRLENGRLVHRTVTAEQAAFLTKAIANYRAIVALLHEWDRETLRILAAEIESKRRKQKEL